MRKFVNRFLLFLSLISFLQKTKAQQYSPAQIDSLITESFQLADRKKALAISSKIYEIANKTGNYYGKAKALKSSINSYLGLGEQTKTLELTDQLFELAQKENDYYYAVQALIGKTLAYAYLGFFDKAYKTSQEAEVISKKITDNIGHYSSMGQIYASRSEIMNLQYKPAEERLKYDLKSVEFYEKIKDQKERNAWLAIQYSNLGYTYIDVDQYNNAIYYNRKAYLLSKMQNDSINQAFGLYGIGNAYLEMKHLDSSIYYYQKALPIFTKSQDIYRLQYIYDDLSTIYQELGDAKNYAHYSQKYREITDIIRKKEKIETGKVSVDILHEEKSEWYQNLYFLLSVISIFAAMSAFFTWKYFRSYKKEKTEREATKVNLLRKEEKLSELELKINDAFTELLEMAKNNDSAFLSRFKEIYPDFYIGLTTVYPELTTGQLQFCALLKLNFSTKEIANYSNISVRSVEMRKNRLRKQLGISSEIDLNKWMINF